MPRTKRDEIHIISRNSNWSATGVEKALKEEVYNGANSWKKFLKLLLVSLGVGFTVAGTVFFFAYNWTELPKFAKLGMVEVGVLITVLLFFVAKLNQELRNIVLTGAAVLVGVMFAVFGQIYQTGANAYDFFLGWTAFIALWVLVANFPPLWLLFLTLCNTTFILYSEQVAFGWHPLLVMDALVVFNSVSFIAFTWLSAKGKVKAPRWFTYIIAMVAVSIATVCIVGGMFNKVEWQFMVSLLLTVAIYIGGAVYAFRQRNIFLLGLLALSLIVIISALIIKADGEVGGFLTVTVFVTISVPIVIMKLIEFQKTAK
ncbi:DUF2157 domain-containing protein [Limibacter armeniacum]|uniref:DUF2157 domain-containing protein n=1 Tax=Limibacter armeniacum TaxID=466084 RepID=UPI002FE67A1E